MFWAAFCEAAVVGSVVVMSARPNGIGDAWLAVWRCPKRPLSDRLGLASGSCSLT